jgi:hypothetical protein
MVEVEWFQTQLVAISTGVSLKVVKIFPAFRSLLAPEP